MADQNITALPKKTSSQLAATDYLLGIDSAEGYQMLIQDLGDYIIQHATSSLAGSSQTLANAINALNSKLTYKAGDTIILQAPFIGKATNAMDGFFGAIYLPNPVSSNSLNATLNNVAQYGIFFSDGADHTVTLSEINNITFNYNVMWFRIPATGITNANTFAWFRLQLTVTFSS